MTGMTILETSPPHLVGVGLMFLDPRPVAPGQRSAPRILLVGVHCHQSWAALNFWPLFTALVVYKPRSFLVRHHHIAFCFNEPPLRIVSLASLISCQFW
jgi:hypothetical protein